MLFGAFALHVFFAPLGYFAVRSACATDGSLSVEQHPIAEGYLHSGYQWAQGVESEDCGHCAEQVAAELFKHVNFRKPVLGGAGYVQYRLEPESNPNCAVGASYQQPPAGRCVAIVTMQGHPADRYEYRSELVTRRHWLLVPIVERRRTLSDTTTRQAIAVQRYFSYATPFERHGRFEPSYHCDRTKLDPRIEGQFFDAVFAR